MTNRLGKKGSALVLVMCLMAGITVLCLAVLLAAYSLSLRVHLRGERETARILAESVSRRLSRELTGQIYEGRPQDPEASVFAYVGFWILDPEEDASSQNRRSFQVSGDWPDEAGQVQVDLRWSAEEGDTFADTAIYLTAEVTCFFGERSVSVTQSYEKINLEDAASKSSAFRRKPEASGSAGSRRSQEMDWKEEGAGARWKWAESNGTTADEMDAKEP